MVKHTQTIRRQIADELFESVSPFCEIPAKRVKAINFHKTPRKKFLQIIFAHPLSLYSCTKKCYAWVVKLKM